MNFFQLSAKMLRQMEGLTSLKEPCITIVNGFFSIVKYDLLVALDKTTGGISSKSPFKPFDWPGSTLPLGKKYIYSVFNLILVRRRYCTSIF